MLRTVTKMTVLIVALLNLAISTPPILKTGPCPVTSARRYAPPTTDNWSQYAGSNYPPAPFVTGCSTANHQNCTLQLPVPPDSSINCVQVPSDLRAELVASERTPAANGIDSSMGYIMEVSFDERGRVWAAEPRDYPAILNDPNPTNRATGGLGRILILEDIDGDGSLDHFKVFYKGLVMPTSVEPVPGGVLAVVAPNIYFIPASSSNPDTAGGPAVAIFTGTGASTGNGWDTHGGLNSIFYGVDNWYYGHEGYNGNFTMTPSSTGVSGTSGSGAIWRFKHTALLSDSTVFQGNWSTGQSNAHGNGQMEDGQIFQSGATCSDRSRHAYRKGQAAISIDAYNSAVAAYYPITTDSYIIDCLGYTGAIRTGANQSTATSGHDFYTARLLPSRFWNTRSFTCASIQHLCGMDSLTVRGSTWGSARPGGTPIEAASNIFASTDAWTAPFKVRTGPDGALWVVDWYDYLITHNYWTPATNAAWNNALRTKSRTRLYRIVPADGHTDPVLNLTNASTAQLVSALYNNNFLWRLWAQRLLISKGYSAELGDSLQSILTNHKSTDAVGIDGPVISAVWTLEGLHRLTADSARWNPILKGLLLHPAWGVRENVLKAMPRTAISAQIISDQCAANDPHPHVRLQAYIALAESPAAPSGPVQGTYSATDSYATSTFNAAGSTKLAVATPANTRPASCAAVVGISLNNRTPSQPYNSIRYTIKRNGFHLQSFGQISGELVVYDIRGQAVFHSTYNSSKGEWSQADAKGLNMSVYFYSFYGINGDRFDDKLFMGQGL